MKRLFSLALILGIVVIAPSVKAAEPQGPEYTLDPIIVTARGYATSQSETPGSIGVVDEKEIALAQKGSIVDALERIPGITRTGASPWGQDISIRGLTGSSVVILVNGKRINTATNINARLGFINPADVERIEVLKGPVSALYGSGSTGGVVNIITRKGAFTDGLEVHGRLSATGSTNPGGGDAYGNLSLSGSNVWGFISGAYREYGDTFGGKNENIPNSQYEDNQGRAMLGIRPWAPVTLTFEAMQSKGDDIGLPGGSASFPQDGRITYPTSEFSLFSADLSVDIDGQYFKSLEANLYYTENKRRVIIDQLPAGVPFSEIRPAADHETLGGKVQAMLEMGNHTIVTGVDFWTWDITSSRRREFRNGRINLDTPVPDATQVSIGAFAEDNWELSDAFTLNYGARLDFLNTESEALFGSLPGTGRPGQIIPQSDEDDLGWHLHAGLTHDINNTWTQSFLLASSYRAADILERYQDINLNGGRLRILGDPDLNPEQSYYGEYSLRYDAKPFKADLRLFANIITDYIAEGRAINGVATLENVEDARIYGTELDMRWDFHDNFGLYGNVAALYGRNEGEDEALPDVAPVTARIGVDFNHVSGFWARIESDMIAKQNSRPTDVDSFKGVMLLGAAAGYSFYTGEVKHDISLALDNIFDTQYYNYLAQQRNIDVWENGFAALLSYSLEF